MSIEEGGNTGADSSSAGASGTGASIAAVSGESRVTPSDPRRWYLAAGVLLFAAVTYVAAIQDVRLDALQAARLFTVDWWFEPIEINPGKRMPIIDGDLNDVFALEDGRHVWAVGAKGLIIHSADGGRTWEKQRIEPMAATSKPPSMPLPNEPVPSKGETGADASPAARPRGKSPARTVHFASMQEKNSREQERDVPNRAAQNPAVQTAAPSCETDADCDDALFCNGAERCVKGSCESGENPCDPKQQRCNEDTGSCERIEGCRTDTECDDGDACTIDSCQLNLGSCLNQPVQCPDGEECDPITGECDAADKSIPDVRRDLTAIWMTDASTGWAAGDNVLVHCARGTWTVESFEPYSYVDLALDRKGDGWAVASGSAREFDVSAAPHEKNFVVQALYRGRSYPQYRGDFRPFIFLPRSVWMSRDGMSGVCVGKSNYVKTPLFFRVDDGGWNQMNDDLAGSLMAVSLDESGQNGWGVGHERIVRFRQSEFVHDTTLPWDESLSDVWVSVDARRGIAVGIDTDPQSSAYAADSPTPEGIVYRLTAPETPEGAWSVLESGLPTCAPLARLSAAGEGRNLWAVGERGTILATRDAGVTWFFQSRPADEYISAKARSLFDGPYLRLPAPWYYLSLLLPVFFLVKAREPSRPRVVRTGIADKLTSDRPLREGDPDPLDIGRIATGVANFLHNRKTEPPMTLAVTGAWGTGKSSLMNLIRAKLDSRGNPTVWFNAWHHQKEEHLLAALLETVRAQAVPAWWSLDGAGFRARLLWLRGRKNPGLVATMLLIFALCSGYIAVQLAGGSAGAGGDASSDVAAASKSIWSRIAELSPDADWLALLGVVFPPLVTLLKGFRAFGVSPGKLMSAATGSADSKDLEAQAGFRARFSREFEEVAEALKPARLSVFIDDLDRCRPQNVLDALEAINFLISAGECFVILGVDRDQVTRCVALAFKDVASELARETQAAHSDDADPHAGGTPRVPAHLEFARHYMEKLVNIEVKVPKPTPSSAVKIAKLLRPKTNEQAEKDLGNRRKELRKATLRSAGAVASVFLLLAGGAWLGGEIGRPETKVEIPPGSSKRSEGQTGTEDPTTDLRADTTTRGLPSARPEARGKGALDPGEESHTVWWAMAGLPVLVIFGLWGVKRGSVELIDDSKDFAEALERWLPLVASARNKGTPRAVKRFVNSVRYYEMLQPTMTDEATNERSGRVPVEPLIVMAAGSELNPEWCHSGELRGNLQAALDKQIVEWERLEQSQPTNGADAPNEAGQNPGALMEKLEGVIAGVDDPAIARFRILTEGVRIGGAEPVPIALAESSATA